MPFIIGLLLLWRIASKASLLERLGFALPVGLGVITVCMLLMDWVGLALSRTNMTVLTLALLAATTALNYKSFKLSYLKSQVSNLKPQFQSFSWFNLVWLLLFVGVIYLEYINISKCLIYPTYDRDSMAAFDTFGYVCSQEGTYLRMSLFEPGYIPSLHHAGSAMGYMPMLQFSYAYVYIFGAATSKAVPAFIYLGFLFGLYGLCRRKLTHTASMLALMGIMLTPEMTSFASHSMTNVMHACVASAAIIYLCLWLERREIHDLRLCAVLLAVNVWMRAEGIVFIGVALLLVAATAIRRKQFRRPLSVVYCLLSLLPLVLWTVCSHACGLTSESALIMHPFWDGEKMLTILSGIWGLMSGGEFYGWTFNLALIMVLVLLFYRLLRRTKYRTSDSFSGWLICAILLGLAGYILVLYHVDYQWDTVQNVLAFSAKRFLFCFVPMAWYFSVSVLPMRKLAEWFERTCGIGKVIN
ncbi:MAG: hypothetical protein J5593_06240 [Bacteroidaceae bacterium]|nr:hypothetical protein [Bacteroidaceae bacterium]